MSNGVNSVGHILYVDNDCSSCEVFREWALRRDEPYDLTCMNGAARALDLIAHHSFDLIVLDYCLLDMTGAELCGNIRSQGSTTPVIIYTALSRDIDRQTAISAGADAFLIKPDEFGTLAATIRDFLDPKPVRYHHHPHPIRRASAIV